MEKDNALETNHESQPLGPGARLSLWIGVIRAREEVALAITGWEDGDKAAIVAATKQKLRTGR